jgi:hypothetical protein
MWLCSRRPTSFFSAPCCIGSLDFFGSEFPRLFPPALLPSRRLPARLISVYGVCPCSCGPRGRSSRPTPGLFLFPPYLNLGILWVSWASPTTWRLQAHTFARGSCSRLLLAPSSCTLLLPPPPFRAKTWLSGCKPDMRSGWRVSRPGKHGKPGKRVPGIGPDNEDSLNLAIGARYYTCGHHA